MGALYPRSVPDHESRTVAAGVLAQLGEPGIDAVADPVARQADEGRGDRGDRPFEGEPRSQDTGIGAELDEEVSEIDNDTSDAAA